MLSSGDDSGRSQESQSLTCAKSIEKLCEAPAQLA
jgi:hypothetical protein